MLKILIKTSIFYSLIRLIILIVIGTSGLYDFIYYHYSNDFTWLFLSFILPLLTSLIISLKLKAKFLLNLGKIFLPLLIIVSIAGFGLNKKEWGYFLKRPSVFSEITDANEILSITRAHKKFDSPYFEINTDTIRYKKYDYFVDLYYSNFERPFITFEHSRNRGNLWRFEEITNLKELKVSNDELRQIEKLLQGSSLLEIPEMGYEKYGNDYIIQIIEFVTSEDDNILTVPSNEYIESREPSLDFKNRYFFITIQSGQISNDHYPVYEYLIKDNEIIKSQKYFYDLAGMEGIEYPLFSPIIECLLLLISLIMLGIYKLSLWTKNKWFSKNTIQN